MKEQKKKLENACREFEEDLVLYYYGDGSAAERSRVEGHLKDCSRCSAFVLDLRKLLPQMAQPKELPPAFWDNYYREMVQKLVVVRERNAWWRNIFAQFHGWAIPAFGTAVVIVLGLGLTLGSGRWNLLSQSKQETIPQEIMADGSDLEFFKSMDLVESLHVLEALDGKGTAAKSVGHS
jgi:predicted anti-sigma-YlaC factor YlaD